MQLTGRIKHQFPQGKVVRIGQIGEDTTDSENDEAENDDDDNEECETVSPVSGSKQGESMPDIVLVGASVWADHATITNTFGKCVLHTSGSAAEFTFVNGLPFREIQSKQKKQASSRIVRVANTSESPADEEPPEDTGSVVLQHTDCVAFGQGGQCLYLFVDPKQGQAELLISSCKVTYAMARTELANNNWKNARLKLRQAFHVTKALQPDSLKLDDPSHDTSDIDQDGLPNLLEWRDRELQEKMQVICEKDRDIAELQRLLAMREAEVAKAQNEMRKMSALLAQYQAMPGGARAVKKLERGLTEETQLPQSESSDDESEDTHADGTHLRSEIMNTFQDAISAIENAERIFHCKMRVLSLNKW